MAIFADKPGDTILDSRQFRIIATLLGIIGAALLALVLVLVFSGNENEPVAGPPATTATPATQGPAVTVPQTAPPTPAPPPATPVPAPPTTASPPDTTMAPPPPPTTTTTTEPPLPLELVLQDDGIGGVPFGTDPEMAIAYAESVLGPVGNDTGWIEASSSKYGVCPGDVVRGAEWGIGGTGFGFALLFTQSPTTHLPGGGPHLFGYYYFGEPAGLETEAGIGVGSTLGDAQAGHPGSTIEEHPLVVGSSIWLADVDPNDQAVLWGFAGGLGTDTPLTSINGGSTCGE
jgi:hypothetical protein